MTAAFSSPGAFGFYPWIDAGKTTYGIVARADMGGAIPSVYCGRLIRKAWMTAITAAVVTAMPAPGFW